MEWANDIKMTDEEEHYVKLLRNAGCKCKLPLLGFIPNQGPRCRMCGIETVDERRKKAGIKKWKENGNA